MAVMRFNFRSQVLSLCVDVTITYPDGRFIWSKDDAQRAMRHVMDERTLYRPNMKLQTVYVLHGGSDDDTTILRETRLERYAERNCVMTVTPQVKDSFYVDTAYGFRYFTFVTQELPCVVQSLFASSPKREDNFLIGLAMGGNGALALGLKHPEKYAAVVDLSGGIGCTVNERWFREELDQLSSMRRFACAFGIRETAIGGEFDLSRVLAKAAERPECLPQLSLAVGERDFIRDIVRKDRDALVSAGVPLRYEEAPGMGHDWDFWDLYVGKAMDSWLPLRRTPESIWEE